jgi:hypothetical protein
VENEILVKVDIRSGQGINSSLYAKHEVFAIIDTRRNGWRTAPIYINSDQWSGWVFEGDGTAKAEARATLWGLAELVTGNGCNWNKIEGYSGDPEKMPIGQIVNYSKITRIIPTNILIVNGSGHTSESVTRHIQKAVKILNPQQVPVLFDYHIVEIQPLTTGGVNLLEIPIGLDDLDSADIIHNLGYLYRHEKGIIADETGNTVDLFDTSGETFIQIYTKEIRNRVGQQNNTRTRGFGFYSMTTAVLSKELVDTTLAHEICHNFVLGHENNDENNLMYPTGDGRVNDYLNHSQVAEINKYLSEIYPLRFNRSNFQF